MATTPREDCALCELSEDLIAAEIAGELVALALARGIPLAEVERVVETTPLLAGAR